MVSVSLINLIHHTYSQLTMRCQIPILNSEKIELEKEDETEICNQFFEFSMEQWLGVLQNWKVINLCPYLRNFDHEKIASALFQQFRTTQFYFPFNHPSYPKKLRFIDNPPAAISIVTSRAEASIDQLSKFSVAIVGARKAAPESVELAYTLGYLLTLHKVVVISGGALGCDIAAHTGCLSAHYRQEGQAQENLHEHFKPSFLNAAVVFAGGLKYFYPKYNQMTFTSLQNSGALFLSERLYQAAARPLDFPIRNRIITGLADLLIFIQGDIKSGAMSSVKAAMQQGRDVYVFDGGDLDVRYSGNRQLLESGAKGFRSIDELMEEILKIILSQ